MAIRLEATLLVAMFAPFVAMRHAQIEGQVADMTMWPSSGALQKIFPEKGTDACYLKEYYHNKEGSRALICSAGRYLRNYIQDQIECIRCDTFKKPLCSFEHFQLHVADKCMGLVPLIPASSTGVKVKGITCIDLDDETGACIVPQRAGTAAISIPNAFIREGWKRTTGLKVYDESLSTWDLTAQIQAWPNGLWMPSQQSTASYKCCCQQQLITSCFLAEARQARCPSDDCKCLAGVSWTNANPKCIIKTEEFMNKAQIPTQLHVIGDTHGDMEHLVLCLLSTRRFKLIPSETSAALGAWTVTWDPDEAYYEFEVVMLGDMVDKGIFDLEIVNLLMQLQSDDRFGRKLVVLQGNHESMLLTGFGRPAPHTSWSRESRVNALLGGCSNDKSEGCAMQWLQRLPVVYSFNRVLLTHGGVDREILEEVRVSANSLAKEDDNLHNQIWKPLERVTAALNKEAGKFYKGRRSCLYKHVNDPKFCPTMTRMIASARACNEKGFCKSVPRSFAEWPAFLGKEEGMLWFRGYSDTGSHGSDGPVAGSLERCQEAEHVARSLGAWVMVMAHTTMKDITKFCRGLEDVPVFVVDTHPFQCSLDDKCDFDISKSPQASREAGNPIPGQLANFGQSLQLSFEGNGFVPRSFRCTAEFQEGVLKRRCDGLD